MSDYATLIWEHTTLTCQSVDRFFLQGHVPHLQSVGQICQFLRWQRRFPIPFSTAFLPSSSCVVKQGPFAQDGLCCPARHHRYGPLRLPLGCRPLPGVTGYRKLAPDPRRTGAE